MLKQFQKYNRVTRLLQHSVAAALRQASSCTHALALCATIGLAASAAQAQVTGGVLAWGSNSEGQTTIPASALSGVSAIAGGGFHTIALKDGAVLAWGRNSSGQCTIPAAAQSGVTAIAGGDVHTIALKNGAVLAWGAGTTNQINGGSSRSEYGQCIIPASASSGVSAIAGGGMHTIALRVPAPTINQVTPAEGPLAGGTTITIRGTNFVAGATSVSVDGNPATSVVVTSPISLTAVTPLGSIAGSVSVDVTTLGRTISRANAFTYEAPPCPADLNGDGVVNSLDMVILLNAFGNCPPSPTSCPADLNGDGVVNALDVIILSNAYGDC